MVHVHLSFQRMTMHIVGSVVSMQTVKLKHYHNYHYGCLELSKEKSFRYILDMFVSNLAEEELTLLLLLLLLIIICLAIILF